MVEINAEKCFLQHMRIDKRDHKFCVAYRYSTPGFIEHPCPFPEEIPYRLMKLYSYEANTIIDPFNGNGQTTQVAFHFHRTLHWYRHN